MESNSARLYRIVGFDRLKDEIIDRALGFVTYDLWEDPSEGPILRALATPDGSKRVHDWLLRNGHKEAQMLIGLLSNLRKTVHMQSWSAEDESSLMWEAYGRNGRAIRIGTTREKVGLLKGVSVIDVSYKEIKLSDELSRVFQGGQIHLGQVFSTKRPIYRHECECRLMSDIDTSWIEKGRPIFSAPPEAVRASLQGLVDQGAMTTAQLEEAVTAWYKQAYVKPVSFAHIPNFIDSLLVGPRATPEFSLEVEKFCHENGIGFAGKSKMLGFELPED